MADDDDDLFGTDPKFLHRAEGPDTSIAAAYSLDSKGKERAVLEAIGGFPQGCISDELRDTFPKKTPYSTMTARYAALDRKGLIRRKKTEVRLGLSRRYQMVMHITRLGLLVLAATAPKDNPPEEDVSSWF
jgi:hypothetical protein